MSIHSNFACEFKAVNKKFHYQHQKTLKEFVQAFFQKQKTLEEIHVLKDITFTIKKGESIGIVGRNGAGKSTLLKLIAGVSAPTSGSITVNGKLAPLIELGAGFHPELSGRENIFLNGVIMGLTSKQVKERFNDIVDFAEIHEFIDSPIKHYSSGMYMRLAFSVAIMLHPDIMLIDEILAVGDIAFQKKCLQKMQEFKKDQVTFLLVSHNVSDIKSFCNRVIYLKNGFVEFDGEVEKGIQMYENEFIHQNNNESKL